MTVRRLPLAHYVDLLDRKVSFVSLLFGDGEFRVMAGEHQGEEWTTYKEWITPPMRDELLECMHYGELPGTYYATDPNIIEYEHYAGGDRESFQEVGRNTERLLSTLPSVDWVDGTVWDHAAQYGLLAPLIKVLRRNRVVLVGNKMLQRGPLRQSAFVECPRHNAYSEIDRLEQECIDAFLPWPHTVYALCCGLSAIPLACRLRGKIGGAAAILDLGSCLDVFVGQGADRGWRYALYRDRDAYRALLNQHLEGL